MNYQLIFTISSLLIVSGCGWGKQENKEHKHNPHKTSEERKHHGVGVKTQAATPSQGTPDIAAMKQKARARMLEKCKASGKEAECAKYMKQDEPVKTQLFNRDDKEKTRVLGREKKHHVSRLVHGDDRN